MSNKKDTCRKFFYNILKPLLRLLAWTIYRVKLSKEKIQGQYLVLSNHSSLIDSVLVSSMFTEPVYFVAASFLVKSKFWGKLLKLLTGIIPIDKAGFDIKALRKVLKMRAAGHSIGIFPEGNNSINGSPLHFGIGIAKLAKQLNLPVALCTNFGGYLTHPKWALYRRKGSVQGKIARIISAEEVMAMPLEELYKTIKDTISVDAYSVQDKEMKQYRGKALSKGIEALFYLCSECSGEATLRSTKDGFECTKCGAKMRYTEYGYIEGSRFTNTRDWDNWQIKQIYNYCKGCESGSLVYSMDNLEFIDFTGEERVLIDKGTFELFTDRIVFGNHTILIKDIQGTALHYINGVLITTVDQKNYGFINKNLLIPGIHMWYAIDALRDAVNQNYPREEDISNSK